MKGKMRAVRLHKPGDLRCEEISLPQLANDEVLIKVKAVGICGSDPGRVMVKGTYSFPMTIGHEFSGQIVECGPKVTGWQSGDRVTIVPLIPCYQCEYCQIGAYNLCENYSYYGSRENGSLADYIKVKAENLLQVPDNVDDEEAACTDPCSVALHALRKAEARPGNTTVVLGTGPIGHFTIQWAKICGAGQVIAVDVMDEKLDIAKTVGADVCINATREDPVKIILDYTDNKGVDYVYEMAGNKITQEQAFAITKKLGTAVFCGISYSDLPLSKKAVDSLLRKEIKVIGSWNSSFTTLPLHEWTTVLNFMSSGKIQCKPLITHRFRLEDAPEVFENVFKKEKYFNKVIFLPEI